MAKTGVLHTSSLYGITETDLTFSRRSAAAQDSALSSLKSEEEKLYHEFQCNTYEEFLDRIKELFNTDNIEVLQRYQPAELSTRLERFRGGRGELYEQEVLFSFDFSKMQKLNLTDVFTALGSSARGERIEIGFKYNSHNVKKLFNTIYKDRYFLTESENMQAVNAQMALLMDSGALEITTQNPTTGIFDEKFKFSSIPNFPWGVTKQMYDRAKKQNNTEVLQEFARATRDIEHFICVELSEGATTALRTAIKWTWMKNFSAAQRDPAFFFQGTTGSNFISAVQGSLGEFQAAVIFTFLEQTIGRRTAYSTLIGDKLKHGEQLKTDVSIIQGLGLQVKNMNTIENNGQTQLIRDLETNIHPNKLVSYLGENSNFLDFIANYYFNTDFAKETQSLLEKKN